MDEIQRVLVKAGRKDLAQKYYKKVNNKIKSGMMSPLGSGEQVDVDGKVALKANMRNKINRVLTKKQHFKSVAELSKHVMSSFKNTDVVPMAGYEKWTGAFTGSPNTEAMEKMKISLTQGTKEVKNAMLILNIYKMQSGTLELNAYIS